jgi:hypothetical protein
LPPSPVSRAVEQILDPERIFADQVARRRAHLSGQIVAPHPFAEAHQTVVGTHLHQRPADPGSGIQRRGDRRRLVRDVDHRDVDGDDARAAEGFPLAAGRSGGGTGGGTGGGDGSEGGGVT